MYLKVISDDYANFMYVCLELNYVPFVIEYRYANICMQLIQLFSRQVFILCLAFHCATLMYIEAKTTNVNIHNTVSITETRKNYYSENPFIVIILVKIYF